MLKLRIFLSWSGDRSKYLAEAFKEWLPNVLQYVDPYMSAKDIKLGERWATNIEDNLREHDFGLVFVTPENIEAPWINFEAGALTKNLKSRVIPIIFESEVSILNQGPLKQFQSQKQLDEDSIRDLIKSINSAESDPHRLSNERVDRSFNMWWPELKQKLSAVPDVPNKDSEHEEDENTFDKQALVTIISKLDKFESDLNNNVIYKDYQEVKPMISDLRFNVEILKKNYYDAITNFENNKSAKFIKNMSFQIEAIDAIQKELNNKIK